MVLDREVCRLPGTFVVTGFAIAAIFAAGKLTAMLVLVTVQAARKPNMRFEVLAFVTVLAGRSSMFAEQRIVRLAVVEPIAREDLLPPTGCVATLAIAAECVAMRVLVAGCAVLVQAESLVLDRTIRRRGRMVALIACQPGVQAGEWIARPLM